MKSSNTDNDIRVTFALPIAAAARLKQMVDGGSPGLREMGILSVEINEETAFHDRIEGFVSNSCSAEFNKLSFEDNSLDMLSLFCKPLPSPEDLENTKQNIRQYLSQPLNYETNNLVLPVILSAGGRDMSSPNYTPSTTTCNKVRVLQQAGHQLTTGHQVNCTRPFKTEMDANVQNYSSEAGYFKSACGSYRNWQHYHRMAHGDIAVDGRSLQTAIARPGNPMYAKSSSYSFKACLPRLCTSTSLHQMQPYFADSFSHVEPKAWRLAGHSTTSPCLMNLLHSNSHVAKNQQQQQLCGPFETVLTLPPAKRKFHKSRKDGIVVQQNSQDLISPGKIAVNKLSSRPTTQSICPDRKPIDTAIPPNSVNCSENYVHFQPVDTAISVNHSENCIHLQPFGAAKQLENCTSRLHSGMAYSSLHVVSTSSHSTSSTESVLISNNRSSLPLESYSSVHATTNSSQVVSALIPFTLISNDALTLDDTISTAPAILSADSENIPSSINTLNSSDIVSIPVHTTALSKGLLPLSFPAAMAVSASVCIIPASHTMFALTTNPCTVMPAILQSGHVPLHHIAFVTSPMDSFAVQTVDDTVHSFSPEVTAASGTKSGIVLKSACRSLTSTAASATQMDASSITTLIDCRLNNLKNCEIHVELTQNAGDRSSQFFEEAMSKSTKGSNQLHQDQVANSQPKMFSTAKLSVGETIHACNSAHDFDTHLEGYSFSSSKTSVISLDSKQREMYASYDIAPSSVYMKRDSSMHSGANPSLSSMPIYSTMPNSIIMNRPERDDARVAKKISDVELVRTDNKEQPMLNKVCVSSPISHHICQPSARLSHHPPRLEVMHQNMDKLDAHTKQKADVIDKTLGVNEDTGAGNIQMGIKASSNNQYGSLNSAYLCTQHTVSEEGIVATVHDGICCILPAELKKTTKCIPDFEFRMPENLLNHVETSACVALEHIEQAKVASVAVDIHETNTETTGSNNIEGVSENPSNTALNTTFLCEEGTGADTSDRNGGDIQSSVHLVNVIKSNATSENEASRSCSVSVCKDMLTVNKVLPVLCSTNVSTSSLNDGNDIRINSISTAGADCSLVIVMTQTGIDINSQFRPSLCSNSLMQESTDRETTFDVPTDSVLETDMSSNLAFHNSQISNDASFDKESVIDRMAMSDVGTNQASSTRITNSTSNLLTVEEDNLFVKQLKSISSSHVNQASGVNDLSSDNRQPKLLHMENISLTVNSVSFQENEDSHIVKSSPSALRMDQETLVMGQAGALILDKDLQRIVVKCRTNEAFKSCQTEEILVFSGNPTFLENSKISRSKSVSTTVNSLNNISYSTMYPSICSTVANCNSSPEFCEEMHSRISSVEDIVTQNETAFRDIQDNCSNQASSYTCCRTDICNPSFNNGDQSANSKHSDIFQPIGVFTKVSSSSEINTFNISCLPELSSFTDTSRNQDDHESKNGSGNCPIKAASITVDENVISYAKVSLPFSLAPEKLSTGDKSCNSDSDEPNALT